MWRRLIFSLLVASTWSCTNRHSGLVGDLSRSTIVVTPPQVPADGVTQAVITVTLITASGDVLGDVPVTLTPTASLGLLTGTTNADRNGIALGYATSTQPGTMTFEASVNFEGYDVPLPRSASIVYVDPNTIVQGGTTTATTGGSATTAGTATTGGTGASTTTAGTTTSGTTTAGTTTSGTTTGGSTTGGTTTGGAGIPSSPNSTFTVNPNTVVADGVQAGDITLVVEDDNGNAVAGQTCSFTSTDTNDVFTPQSGDTNSTGTLTATVTSTNPASVTLTATCGSMNLTTAMTFTAVVPPHLVFSQQPVGNQPSPCAMTTVPIVQIVDSGGNILTGNSNIVTLAFANNANHATLNGTTSIAASSGAATFGDLTVSTDGSGYTLVATSPGITSANSNAFNIAGTCASGNVMTNTNSTLAAAIAGIAAGDFNGDGHQDVLIYDSGGNNQDVEFLYGNGTGAFPTSAGLTLPFFVSNIVATDFNNDGYADFAVVNGASTNVNTSGTVYLNNQAGGFSTVAVGLGTNPNYITLFDVNRDGNMDLIAGTTGGQIIWDYGNGAGGFTAYSAINSNTTSASPVWAAYRVFDGAGNPNALVFMYGTSGAGFTADLLTFSSATKGATGPGISQSKWGTQTVFACPSSSANILVYMCVQPGGANSQNTTNITHNGRGTGYVDINGDGVPDILAASDTGLGTILAASASSCNPGATGAIATGHKTTAITTADFNGDGIVDVATANYDNNGVTAILSPQ